jgi:hypothetical protein
MALHGNGEQLFFSTSSDGAKFREAQTLFAKVDDSDRYIVSVGWVTRGAQDERGRRVLGLLYGAGPKASLDNNRIFACWLQKKLVFTVNGKPLESKTRAVGPDRQLIFFQKPIAARVELLGDDGATPIARTDGAVDLEPRGAYELTFDRATPAGAGRSR